MRRKIFFTFIILLSLASFVTSASDSKFRRKSKSNFWKIAKVNKKNLAIIIKRLRSNDTRIFDLTKNDEELSQCPKFMIFEKCACEPSCEQLEPICTVCTSRCVCRDGFLRHPSSRCVLPEDCTKTFNRIELSPPRRLYEAVRIIPSTTEVTSTSTQTTPNPPDFEQNLQIVPEFPDLPTTQPLIFLRPSFQFPSGSGPTPPPSPPIFGQPPGFSAPEVDLEMIGAPSITPPPDFSYGPPGMDSGRYILYENYLKQKRILRALRKRRNRVLKKL